MRPARKAASGWRKPRGQLQFREAKPCARTPPTPLRADRPNRANARLPLALTAIVAVLALGPSPTRATHGRVGRFCRLLGGRIRGQDERRCPSRASTRHPSLIANSGGQPGTGGDNRRRRWPRSGGHSGNDRPHRPRFPKHPIVVGVPTDRCRLRPRRFRRAPSIQAVAADLRAARASSRARAAACRPRMNGAIGRMKS